MEFEQRLLVRTVGRDVPLEVASADDFLFRQSAEDARNHFVRGIFVVLLEPVIFCDLLPADNVNNGNYDFGTMSYSGMFSSAVISSSRLNCMTRYWYLV